MSGSTNALMPAPAQPQQGAPAMAQAPQPPQIGLHHVSAPLAGTAQQAMISKRDSAGREMTKLAEIANDPDPNRADIVVYINKLLATGQVQPQEAAQILQALPNDGDAIRQWARTMFSALMHVGIHAHAAFPVSAFPGNGQGAAQPEQPEETPGV